MRTTSRESLNERFLGDDATKTFVLEVHPNGHPASDFLASAVGELGRVNSTGDKHLFDIVGDDARLVADTARDRFWMFHTWSLKQPAGRLVRALVQGSRSVDYPWLPSHHVRQLSQGQTIRLRSDFRATELGSGLSAASDVRLQVHGRDGAGLLELIESSEAFAPTVAVSSAAARISDTSYGSNLQAVDRRCAWVASGDSFALHIRTIRQVVNGYRRLVEAIEEHRLRAESAGRGWRPAGAPVSILFRRTVNDMDRFLEVLFSCREPFRLWGNPVQVGEGVWDVEAVDLHVGQRINIQVEATGVTVVLPGGACGNTVARLASNLQHRFDGSLRFADPRLQELLQPTPQPPSAFAPAADASYPRLQS